MIVAFIRKVFWFFTMGLIWLFVFSLPIGHDKQLFSVGYYYVVDTKPVKFFEDISEKSVLFLTKTMFDLATDLVDKMDVKHPSKKS